MDDLENTNNIRFLRRQYKDPMTGEADWRIIHETAGVLTDSLVHPQTQPAQGQNGTGGPGQTFGTLTSNLPFGSSMSASTDESADQPAPKAVGLLFRPSDRGPLGNAHGGVSATDDDTQSPMNAEAPSQNPPPAEATNQAPAAAAQDPNAPTNQAAGAGGGAGSGQPGTTPTDVANMINYQLRSPRQLANTTSGQQSQGVTGGGIGIAGVASKSNFQGIRVYNDKRKYKEWEFVFDMSKLQQLQGAQQPQQQVQSPLGQQSQSPFQSTTQQPNGTGTGSGGTTPAPNPNPNP